MVQLGLGAVQFGMDYGVSNLSGRTPSTEVARILSMAAESGIRVVDTAAVYGDSEAVLGCSWPSSDRLQVVTKTLPLEKGISPGKAAAWVCEGFSLSLERLRLDSVEALLIHHATDLLGPCGDEIYSALLALKLSGRTKKIGLSAYTGSEIDTALHRYELDLVQVPMNVFDQRLRTGGQLQRLRDRKVEIHLRSVFLQGLLLMAPESAPGHFAPIRQHLSDWQSHLRECGMTLTQGALAFVRSLDVDVVIMGIESVEQLKSNVHDFNTVPCRDVEFARFALDDDAFINPMLWKLPSRIGRVTE